MSEIWKTYPSDPHYEVSSLGNIRSVDRKIKCSDGRIVPYKGVTLRPSGLPGKHRRVILSNYTTAFVHRMVAETFLGPVHGKIVRHLDDNPWNNTVENLRIGNRVENREDARRNGCATWENRTHCRRGHEIAGSNNMPHGAHKQWRRCRACDQARKFRYKHPEDPRSIQELSDSYYSRIKECA